MTLSRMVHEALEYLAYRRNASPNTIAASQLAFDQFLAHLREKGLDHHLDDVRHFTAEHVSSFATYLHKRGVKASTVATRLYGLKRVADVLRKMKDERGRPLLAANPVDEIEMPVVEQPETKFPLPDELAAFMAVPRPHREIVAWELLLDTGARVSEVCRANVGDVIQVDGRVSVAMTVKGRGTRERKAHKPLSVEVAASLMDYLLERGIADPQHSAHAGEPLLLNANGKRWTRRGLAGLVERIGLAAGITRFRMSPHKFRHMANILAKIGGIDPQVRSRLLGHSSPASLQRYEHLVPGELHVARDAQRAALARYLPQDVHLEG